MISYYFLIISEKVGRVSKPILYHLALLVIVLGGKRVSMSSSFVDISVGEKHCESLASYVQN